VLYSELFASALQKLDRSEMTTAVEVLIESSFGISRSQFWMRRNQAVRNANGLRRFHRAFARLLANEPLAYILGEKEFYGETFAVSPAVLIPRPETELLVEKALALLDGKAARVLDIGSGSGCIAIILARRSRSTVIALEKSRPALRVLQRNIERFGVQATVRPLAGDLFPGRAAAFRMIVSNPPYLSRQDWLAAPREIRLHEPKTALVSGRAGTEILARIIAGAPRFLEPGSHLLLEIGQGQRRALCGFLKAAGLRELECVRDYAGIERVVVAQME